MSDVLMMLLAPKAGPVFDVPPKSRPRRRLSHRDCDQIRLCLILSCPRTAERPTNEKGETSGELNSQAIYTKAKGDSLISQPPPLLLYILFFL